MLEAIKNRHSVRKYTDKKISEEDLNDILGAIQKAPTWKNKQCFEVIVIDDRKIQTEIGDIVHFNPSESSYFKASHLLVFVADPYKSGNRDNKPYYMADTAIAITHAIIEATNKNIGSCWVGVFPENEIKKYLDIPDELKVIALLPLGYSDEEINDRPRRHINQIVHYNKYHRHD